MLKRSFLYMMTMILFTLWGCTHEDTEDCVQGVRLHFTHLLNNQNANLFGAKVSMVSVYVFDKDGLYLDTYTSKGIKLTNDYVMSLPLKPGTYSFVTLGGDLLTYEVGELIDSEKHIFNPGLVAGKSHIERFAFLLDAGDPGASKKYVTISHRLSHLFHGILDSLSVPRGKITDATIDLIQDTKQINVNILGSDNLNNFTKADFNDKLDTYVLSNNGRYKHDNTIDKYARALKYEFSNYSLSNDTLKTDIIKLRLMNDNDQSRLKLDVINFATLFDQHMVSMIKKNPKYKKQQDFDREDLFVFDIRIQPDLSVTVKVNGWTISDVTPVSENSNK